jgi:hypothetical protein
MNARRMKADPMRPLQQIETALSRWENEGGAIAQIASLDCVVSLQIHLSMHTELDHLRIRMIAIENLLITLLAQADDPPREMGREMATYISPRPGFTPHHQTLEATAQMRHLVKRARHFQDWVKGKVLS